MKKYVLYGFGGHGRVLKDTIEKNGDEVVFIFNDISPYQANVFSNTELIIAIGDNSIRNKIRSEIKHKLGIVIHPDAYVAKDVIIEPGTVVLANAVIQTGCKIGANCIINANVTVDHDVFLEDNVSIYPGAYVGGGAKITKGKTIEPNSVIGRNSIV